ALDRLGAAGTRAERRKGRRRRRAGPQPLERTRATGESDSRRVGRRRDRDRDAGRRRLRRRVNGPVKAACVQAEPVVLDRAGTLDKLERLTGDAAREGARLVVFPETFIPAYPSSAWAKAFAGWADPRAKAAFALLAREALAVPGPDADRLGQIAKEHGVWLVTGVNEVDPARPGTLYNALLYHSPTGELALHHRKLVPTNHERLIWGQGDGGGLRALETPIGRIGGLIC